MKNIELAEMLRTLASGYSTESGRDALLAAARIVESDDTKDAARYRWLCDGHGYFMEEEMLCGHGNDKAAADAAIDGAMRTAQRTTAGQS